MEYSYMEVIRGYPYRTMEKVAEEFGCSKRTVARRVDGIQEEIRNGRYSSYAVLESGGITLINMYVYMDYEKYWKHLKRKNTRKYVPPFTPQRIQELAELCGYCSMPIKEVI